MHSQGCVCRQARVNHQLDGIRTCLYKRLQDRCICRQPMGPQRTLQSYQALDACQNPLQGSTSPV